MSTFGHIFPPGGIMNLLKVYNVCNVNLEQMSQVVLVSLCFCFLEFD